MSKSNNGKELTKLLPSFFSRDVNSSNFKLLEPVGKQVDGVEEDIEDISDATFVQTANSIGELFELSKLVGLSPKTNEPLEIYRSRILAQFQLYTSEATAEDLLNTLSLLMNTSRSNFRYTEFDSGAVILFGIPSNALENSIVSTSELLDILNNNVAAGYRVGANIPGAFSHRSIDDYNNNINDPEAAYGGLDENGDVDESGGNYSGLLT